ncbi:spore coat associated protein CotJA [Bacillus sp. ISL-78]|nr:spore coat associated protein CotJA [Bacillus sp. ISL-78]MBT2629216.1 spore coat associated protein CotJA [Bacillus sp. ISL-101]MBT2717279.1 spore coat associated protein CotJA [Bacillus sp. ISL-57]
MHYRGIKIRGYIFTKEVFFVNREKTFTLVKSYKPFHSKFDPCPPIGRKYYRTPPNLYINFQPPNMEQFTPEEALKYGTLWKFFYDFYDNPYRERET